MQRGPRVVAIAVGAFFVIFGLYAFFAPKAFFDALATFPPYNVHLIHDIGAFQIGVGAILLYVVYMKDALLAVLAGTLVGQVFHLVAHLIDRDLGEKQSTTIPFLVFVTLVLAWGAWTRSRSRAG